MKKTTVILIDLSLAALLLCGCASVVSSAASASAAPSAASASAAPSDEAVSETSYEAISSAVPSSQTVSEPTKNYNLAFMISYSFVRTNWEIAADGEDNWQPLNLKVICGDWPAHGLTHTYDIELAQAEYPGAETVKRWKLRYSPIVEGPEECAAGEVAGSFALTKCTQLEIFAGKDGKAIGTTTEFERCLDCNIEGQYNTVLYASGLGGIFDHWFVSAAGKNKWVSLDDRWKIVCAGSSVHAPGGGDFYSNGENVGLDHISISEYSFFYPEKYKTGSWDFMAVSAEAAEDSQKNELKGISIGSVYVLENIKLDERHWIALQRYSAWPIAEEVHILPYERSSCCFSAN